MKAHSRIHDIVVIGGGLMGSAAAWHLSQFGEEVTLVEQQDTVYTHGSSFGEARITRSLGPKDDIFSYLHNRGVEETKKLIAFLKAKNPSADHRMEDIYTTSPVTYIYYKSNQSEIDELLDKQKDPFDISESEKEAYSKFGMNVPDSIVVIREHKEYSGTLNPKALISKLHQAIRLQGSTIMYHHAATMLKSLGDVYEIKLTDTHTGKSQTILSKKVVTAAGPYNGVLLSEIAPKIKDLITLNRVFLVFIKINAEKYKDLTPEMKKRIYDSYPAIDFSPDLMFTMIEKTDADGIPLIKIGGHMKRETITHPDEAWNKELSSGEIEWGIHQTWQYLNKLNIPLKEKDLEYSTGYSCIYSLTESEVPLVTYIPDRYGNPDRNFVVLGGMSGIGAKGTMAYGLIAANLLMGKEENSAIYQKTARLMGFDRLLENQDLVHELRTANKTKVDHTLK